MLVIGFRRVLFGLIGLLLLFDIYTEEGHGILLPAKGTVSGGVVLLYF